MPAFAPLPLPELIAAMRQRGAIVAEYNHGAGLSWAQAAEWLEVSMAANLDRPLTLEEAARESNWSYEGLRRRLKEEPSLNAGREGAPLIRRQDLSRLGAPRGPRGKYRARKTVPQVPAPATVDSPSPATETEQRWHENDERQSPSAEVMSVSANAGAAPEPAQLAFDEPAAGTPAGDEELGPTPAQRPEKPARRRSAARRTRRDGIDERFASICALAKRG